MPRKATSEQVNGGSLREPRYDVRGRAVKSSATDRSPDRVGDRRVRRNLADLVRRRALPDAIQQTADRYGRDPQYGGRLQRSKGKHSWPRVSSGKTIVPSCAFWTRRKYTYAPGALHVAIHRSSQIFSGLEDGSRESGRSLTELGIAPVAPCPTWPIRKIDSSRLIRTTSRTHSMSLTAYVRPRRRRSGASKSESVSASSASTNSGAPNLRVHGQTASTSRHRSSTSMRDEPGPSSSRLKVRARTGESRNGLTRQRHHDHIVSTHPRERRTTCRAAPQHFANRSAIRATIAGRYPASSQLSRPSDKPTSTNSGSKGGS